VDSAGVPTPDLAGCAQNDHVAVSSVSNGAEGEKWGLVGAAAIAFQNPNVLRFDMAEHVAIAALDEDTEKRFAWGIPAVFYFDDFQG
jgi:hypothetical protein